MCYNDKMHSEIQAENMHTLQGYETHVNTSLIGFLITAVTFWKTALAAA